MIQRIDLYSKDFDIYALGEKINEIIDLLNEKEQTEVNNCVIPVVIPSFYSGFEIKIFESKTIQEGKGALLLNPKDMPRKNEA